MTQERDTKLCGVICVRGWNPGLEKSGKTESDPKANPPARETIDHCRGSGNNRRGCFISIEVTKSRSETWFLPEGFVDTKTPHETSETPGNGWMPKWRC
jgi:hypothetical protein